MNIVNNRVVWLPPAVNSLYEAELDSPELKVVLMNSQNSWQLSSSFIILLNQSQSHVILITHNPWDSLLSQAFRLDNIKFNHLIVPWIMSLHLNPYTCPMYPVQSQSQDSSASRVSQLQVENLQ